MILLSALHDPKGVFETHISELKNIFYDLFTSIYILHTEVTSTATLNACGTSVNQLEGGRYSESKILGIKEALNKHPNETFLYCDFDKVLLWNIKHPDEFKSIVGKTLNSNYLIFGRALETFDTYPKSWVETESITNAILSKQLGCEVDALTATCLFDSKAARVIAGNASGKEWESPAEWPMLMKHAKLTIEYESAKGLEWEDPYFYFDNSKFNSQSEWLETVYNSPQEWSKRLNASAQQVAKMSELTDKN